MHMRGKPKIRRLIQRANLTAFHHLFFSRVIGLLLLLADNLELATSLALALLIAVAVNMPLGDIVKSEEAK